MKKLPILIIAAGSNSRFFPLNQKTHKGGIAVGGQPLLARTLTNLHDHGFDDVVIVVADKDFNGQGLSGQIPTDFLGMDITYTQQLTPKGMGDAILGVTHKVSDQFAVVYPYHTQAGEILSQMINHPESAVIAVTETDAPWNYGIVTLEGELAVNLTEKPAQGTEGSNLKVVGLYILPQSFIDVLKNVPAAEYNFETALDQLMKTQPVKVTRLEIPPPTLKYPWHLFDFQAQLFKSLSSFRSPATSINQSAEIDESHGPVFIDEGATIGHGAKIAGPCYIGKNVLVGDFSLVRGSTIEAGCRIGANSEVVRSLILENSDFHYGYLADSIIGSHVKIGAGLITANKRLDRKNIRIDVKDQAVDTGRNNLGIVVGDGATLGIRVSTMPGVLIGSQAVVYPGSLLYHSLKHEETYKPE